MQRANTEAEETKKEQQWKAFVLLCVPCYTFVRIYDLFSIDGNINVSITILAERYLFMANNRSNNEILFSIFHLFSANNKSSTSPVQTKTWTVWCFKKRSSWKVTMEWLKLAKSHFNSTEMKLKLYFLCRDSCILHYESHEYVEEGKIDRFA